MPEKPAAGAPVNRLGLQRLTLISRRRPGARRLMAALGFALLRLLDFILPLSALRFAADADIMENAAAGPRHHGRWKSLFENPAFG